MNNIVINFKTLYAYNANKNKQNISFIRFISKILGKNIENSKNLINSIHNSLENLGIGLRMILDSYFINNYGKTYAEMLIDNPIFVYNESTKILSEYSAKMIFRSILKSIGLSQLEIKIIINELSIGNDKSFKNAISSAA